MSHLKNNAGFGEDLIPKKFESINQLWADDDRVEKIQKNDAKESNVEENKLSNNFCVYSL